MRSQRAMSVLLSVAVSLATVIAVLSVKAIADGNPATDSVPRLIPYQGTLDRDGVAFNGTVDMEFQLFDGAAAATPAWSETQTVNVYQGRFLALLGSTADTSAAALAAAVGNADDTYLAIVLHPAEGDAVPLSSRQRFFPVPYAMWSTAATDFHVGNRIYIGGTDVNFDAHPDRGDGGRALVHGVGDSLILDFGGDFAGRTIVDGTNADCIETGGTPPLTVRSGTHTMAMDGYGNIQADILNLNRYNEGTVRLGDACYVDGYYNHIGFHNAEVNGVAMGYKSSPEQIWINKWGMFAGGTLIEGTLDIGRERKLCSGTHVCSCPTGKTALGGGGICPDDSSLQKSWPTNDSTWQIHCENRTTGNDAAPTETYVICARLQ